MRLARIPQLYRNFNRTIEVLSILSKYGLASWVSRLGVEFPRKLFRKREGVRLAHHSPEARIRLALTELGPTFIKLGQILSTRADLVGSDVASELEKLQTDAPCERFELIRETIEQELERPLEAVFLEFDEVPLASASIGQVHRARLISGEDVVVKVRHSGIDRKFRVDLDILGGLAQLAEKLPELQNYRPRESVAEIRRTLIRELDFRREMRNLTRFASNFARNKSVRFPKTYDEFCTSRVLVMEWLDGIKLSDLATNEHTTGAANAGHSAETVFRNGQPVERVTIKTAAGTACELSEADKDAVARAGVEAFLEMIFQHGFYHADPHPGNILLLPDNVIGLLDCGMVGYIDEPLREAAEEMLLAIADQDAPRMTTLIHRVGSVPPDVDRSELTVEVADFMAHYANQPLDGFDFGGAVNEFTHLVRRYRIKLPTRMAVLLKVLVMLEGTARLVSPKFSLGDVLGKYRSKLIWRRLNPLRGIRKLRRLAIDLERLAEILPGGLIELFEQIQSGKFDVHLDHRGLEPSVNRLVLGLLTSALFLGSALMLCLDAPPLFRGVSILGLVGTIVSLMLGLRVIWAIRNSGRLDRGE